MIFLTPLNLHLQISYHHRLVKPPPAESASPINLVLRCTPPTSGNIESALHTIGDTKNTNTKHEILQGLKDLNRWAHPSNNHHEFYIEFLELAGISRVLKFLMVPSNMSDMEYVFSACNIIIRCTLEPNDLNIDIALVMGKKFVERGGIHTMLLLNEEYRGGNDHDKLNAVYSIWAVLNNVIYHRTEFDDIDKDKQHNLFDDALATLRLVNGADDETRVQDETRVAHIKCLILNVLIRLLVGPNSKLVADDFEGRDVFQICIDTMIDSNRQWAFHEENWDRASYFFFYCFRGQFFPTQNNNDLKLVISFFVEYIEKAPNEAFKSNAFDFLLEASDVIGRDEIAKTPGLMITLGTILDSSSNNNIEAATEDMTKTLVKYLL
jgi:hypothetical protein